MPIVEKNTPRFGGRGKCDSIETIDVTIDASTEKLQPFSYNKFVDFCTGFVHVILDNLE